MRFLHLDGVHYCKISVQIASGPVYKILILHKREFGADGSADRMHTVSPERLTHANVRPGEWRCRASVVTRAFPSSLMIVPPPIGKNHLCCADEHFRKAADAWRRSNIATRSFLHDFICIRQLKVK